MFLIKFWPILLLIVILLIWVFPRKNKNDNIEIIYDSKEQVEYEKKLWKKILIISLMIVFSIIAIVIFNSEPKEHSPYIAPHYKDGKIIEGEIINQ